MVALLVLSTVAHDGIGQLTMNGHELPPASAYPLAGLLPLVFYLPLGGLALLVSRRLALPLRNALSVALLVLVLLGLVLRLRW